MEKVEIEIKEVFINVKFLEGVKDFKVLWVNFNVFLVILLSVVSKNEFLVILIENVEKNVVLGLKGFDGVVFV